MQTYPQIELLTSPDWVDYELLDSGNGEKLERFGPYQIVRPEPEAIWSPQISRKNWDEASALFKPTPEENGGHWIERKKIPPRWTMQYKDLKFWTQLSASKHLGVFPEQAVQWDWITTQIQDAKRPVKVLNLFGYTGLASLAAAKAGAQVTHIDASRKVVSWASENQQLSNLSEQPIRWIVDDVMKFVQREARRGSFYDGIILDPPKFGRGPKGEVWEFYKILPTLLEACRQILCTDPIFLLLTAYAVKASSLTLYYGVQEIMQKYAGTTSVGEVLLAEKSGKRAISMAIFARWSATTKR